MMSVHKQRIRKATQWVLRLYSKERSAQTPLQRAAFRLARWATMLYREWIKDDIKVRAESLAYLMLFSLLPLVAGAFFIFTIFANFGFVQQALDQSIANLLSTFSAEQQEVLMDFITRSKNAYITHIQGKSSGLGIFALLILFWVGLQTFNNVDRTINFIWSSEKERPFLEKSRNFIVIVFAGPFVLIGSLSIPLILKTNEYTAGIVARAPFITALLNFFIPVALIFGTLCFMYRYVPVRKVQWNSAIFGAAAAAIALQLSNLALNLYFRAGTHTAYGKAAVIPLMAFWIYVVWIIVILGAELSYLFQHEKLLLQDKPRHPSLNEGAALIETLKIFHHNFHHNGSVENFESLFEKVTINRVSLKEILEFLERENIISETLDAADEEDRGFILRRDLDTIPLKDLLKKFWFGVNRLEADTVHDPEVEKRFHALLESFDNFRI